MLNGAYALKIATEDKKCTVCGDRIPINTKYVFAANIEKANNTVVLNQSIMCAACAELKLDADVQERTQIYKAIRGSTSIAKSTQNNHILENEFMAAIEEADEELKKNKKGV